MNAKLDGIKNIWSDCRGFDACSSRQCIRWPLSRPKITEDYSIKETHSESLPVIDSTLYQPFKETRATYPTDPTSRPTRTGVFNT